MTKTKEMDIIRNMQLLDRFASYLDISFYVIKDIALLVKRCKNKFDRFVRRVLNITFVEFFLFPSLGRALRLSLH